MATNKHLGSNFSIRGSHGCSAGDLGFLWSQVASRTSHPPLNHVAGGLQSLPTAVGKSIGAHLLEFAQRNVQMQPAISSLALTLEPFAECQMSTCQLTWNACRLEYPDRIFIEAIRVVVTRKQRF